MLINIKLDSCIPEDKKLLEYILNGNIISTDELIIKDEPSIVEPIEEKLEESSFDIRKEASTEKEDGSNDFLKAVDEREIEEVKSLTRQDIVDIFDSNKRLTSNFFTKLQTGFYGHENVLIEDIRFVGRKPFRYTDENCIFKVRRALLKLKSAPRRISE